MQHGCDFITRKFAAFKDRVVTNNTSESMNNILKSVANYKELPLDTVVLVFVRVQEIYYYDFQRALAGHGDYHLKKSFSHLSVDRSQLELPKLGKVDNIIDEILQTEPCYQTVEKNPNYRLTQRALARYCVQHGMIGFLSTTGLFTVHSADCKKAHCVIFSEASNLQLSKYRKVLSCHSCANGFT